MFLYLIAAAPGGLFDQLRQIVTLEILHLPARFAQQQVLMPLGCAQVHIASIRLVHSLHQTQLLQLLQGAVNGHQSQAGMLVPSQIVDLDRIQGPRAVGDDRDDRPAGGG